MGITCGPGSFAVQFGDRFRSEIICGLVHVGAPNDYCAALVNCFDDEVIPVIKSFERSRFFFRKVGKFGFAIEV